MCPWIRARQATIQTQSTLNIAFDCQCHCFQHITTFTQFTF